MMQRSQEDAVRYLFHMQIVDGPVATSAQQAKLLATAPAENGNQQQPALPPRKRASTSMDDLEAQFQRRKK